MKLQITIDGKTYAAEVEVLEDEGNEQAPDQAVTTPSSAPAPGAYTPGHPADAHSPDDKLYRSPLAGLVIKVNVSPGRMVRSGEVILVLEAMKMETNIVAHHAGKVKSVHAVMGDSVKSHQVLVEME